MTDINWTFAADERPEVFDGEYGALVFFSRNLGDDAAVLEPRPADGAALAVQLAKELQPLFDEGAAGRFQVVAVGKPAVNYLGPRFEPGDVVTYGAAVSALRVVADDVNGLSLEGANGYREPWSKNKRPAGLVKLPEGTPVGMLPGHDAPTDDLTDPNRARIIGALVKLLPYVSADDLELNVVNLARLVYERAAEDVPPDLSGGDPGYALIAKDGPVILTLETPGGIERKAAFATIADAVTYIDISTTIDPVDREAGRYGIDAPHGLGSDLEAVPNARKLGYEGPDDPAAALAFLATIEP